MYPKLPMFDVVYARNGEQGFTFVACESLRAKIMAIRNAMREGVDWIEVWAH